MPGLYAEDEYDVAGFAVGACERENLLDGRDIVSGDVLLGLPSSGLHSNGFSLVRAVLFERHRIALESHVPEFGRTWGEELLEPTRIYVQALLPLLKERRVKGLAHITGGGFIENIPRMLPKGLGATVKLDSWEHPPVFDLLARLGEIPNLEMYNVFNMGIGKVLAVSPGDADSVLADLRSLGEEVYEIGEVSEDEGFACCDQDRGFCIRQWIQFAGSHRCHWPGKLREEIKLVVSDRPDCHGCRGHAAPVLLFWPLSLQILETKLTMKGL